jgi:hypothetical protein
MESVMSSQAQWAFYTRSDRRYAVPRTDEVYVELEDPEITGARRRFALTDISKGGLAFGFIGELPDMQRNTNLPMIVCLGQGVLLGDFVISHVTSESEFKTVCGGKFCPKTQADQLRLIKFIGGFELSQ